MFETVTLADLVTPFVEQIVAKRVEVYNEFSLQHEFGFFLRTQFPADKVQFERNVDFFKFDKTFSFVKREIDISVFSADPMRRKWAIELKFPRNGQYPEQMFSFCRDIVFVEQLKAAGFSHAGLLIFADDHLFWSGRTDGIYGFFRGRAPLHGAVRKPTGARDVELTIRGSYHVEWANVAERVRFAAVEVV